MASLLPAYDPTVKYIGTFFIGDNEMRYQCEVVTACIARDDAVALLECVERGFITRESITFMGSTIVELCRLRDAHKCAAALIQRNWPERRSAMIPPTPLSNTVPPPSTEDDTHA